MNSSLKFSINGLQKYPHPFVISHYDIETNTGNSSFYFFIDAGKVNININDLTTNKNLGYHFISKSNREYQRLKKLYSNSVDTLTGIINNLKTKQKILNKYILKHPNSYVALWDMVIDYTINKSYKKDDDRKTLLENTQLFSPIIKKTKTYQALVKNINQDSKLFIGKSFPDITLDQNQQDLGMVFNKSFPNISLSSIDSLIPIAKKNKFTLIDFFKKSIIQS